MPHTAALKMLAQLPPGEPISSNPAMMDYAIRIMAEHITLKDFRSLVGYWLAANYPGVMKGSVVGDMGVGIEPAVIAALIPAD